MSTAARHARRAVEDNTRAAITAATHRLLDELVGRDARIVSVTVGASADLNAAFATTAAREWGLGDGCVIGVVLAGAARRSVEALALCDLATSA